MDLFLQTGNKVISSIILFICASGLWAQNTNLIVTGNPSIIATGQVTTLSFTGAPTILQENGSGVAIVEASQVPLPTTLAGFSATIAQLPPVESLAPLPLPIFSVRQVNYCALPPIAACILTTLTVQIPIDLALSPFPGGPGISTGIVVSDGDATWTFSPALDPVKVHILTACDPGVVGGGGGSPTISPCNPLITHADGTLVGPLSGPAMPAQPGETLVLYATGLGVTQPGVAEGTVSPNPPAVSLHHFTLIFDYDCGTVVTEAPVFVGLTPGQIGLYQVNFQVPQPVSCTMLPVPNLANSGGNLTLLSDDWISSDTVLLYLGANTPASGQNAMPAR